MRTPRHPWTDNYFTPFYSKVYSGPLRNLLGTEQEVEFLAERLQDKRAGLVLDIGAGFGRHAQGLIKQGFRAVGLDRYAHFLAQWPRRKRLAAAADMRTLPFADASFSAVYCLFNTFGYFDHADNVAMLGEWARVLATGGKLILQLPNRTAMARIARNFPPTQMMTEELTITEQYHYDAPTRCLVGQGVWSWRGEDKAWQFILRLYTRREIERAMARAGLVVESVHEDFRGGEFDPRRSSEMVFVARK